MITLSPDPTAPVVLKPSDSITPLGGSSRQSNPPTCRFHQVLSPSPTASSTLLGLSSTRLQKVPVGSRVEVSPTSFKIAHQIGELVKTNDGKSSCGCSLVVDYGGDHAFGSSFRVGDQSLCFHLSRRSSHSLTLFLS